MAEERIDIVVSDKGTTKIVQRNLEQVGSSAEKSSKGVDLLKSSLLALGTGLTANAVLQLTDSYTQLNNRLIAAGTASERLTSTYGKLLQISNETRNSVEGTVELYSRLAVNSDELGLTQTRLLGFTKSLNQAIILSGASATEASAGLIQLSQGLASGTLRGDELRSVLEQLPTVADVIAKGLGVTRGELRQLGTDGKITAQDIITSFEKASDSLNERFGKTVPTLAQGLTIIKNNTITALGEFDKAEGVTRALGGALSLLSENIGSVIRLLVFGTGAVATFYATAKGAQLLEATSNFIAYRRAIAEGTVVVLGSAEAERQKALFQQQSAVANAEAAASSLRSAQAEEARAASVLQGVRATQAQIAVEREAATARLTAAGAGTAAAGAAVGGAQTAVAAATQALAAAEGRRAAITRDLNLLVAQQTLLDEALSAELSKLAIVESQVTRTTTASTLAEIEAEAATANSIRTTVASLKVSQQQIAVESQLTRSKLAQTEAIVAQATAQANLAAQQALASGQNVVSGELAKAQALKNVVDLRQQEVAIAQVVTREQAALAAAQQTTAAAGGQLAIAQSGVAVANNAVATTAAKAAGSTTFMGQALTGAKAGVTKLLSAIGLSPMGALVAGLGAATVGLYVYRDSIKASSDGTITLGDVLRTATSNLAKLGQTSTETGESLSIMAKILGMNNKEWKEFSFWGAVVEGTIDKIAPGLVFLAKAEKAVAVASKTTNEELQKKAAVSAQLKTDLEKLVGTYDKLADGQKKVKDATELLDKAVANGLITAERRIQLLGLVRKEEFKGLDPLKKLKDEYNTIDEGARKLAEATRVLNAAQKSGSVSATQYAELMGAVNLRLADQIDPSRQIVAQYDAQEAGQQRLAELTQILDVAVNRQKRTLSERNAIMAMATAEIANQLSPTQQLVQQIDSVAAANQQYSNTERLLDAAVKGGSLSVGERVRLMGILGEQLKDQRNPYQAVINQLSLEAELTKKSNTERTVQNRLIDISKNLMQQGITLNADQLLTLTNLISANEKLNRQYTARQEVLTAIQGPSIAFKENLKATADLVASGAISQGDANKYILESQNDLFTGTSVGMEMMVNAQTEAYSRIDALRQADLISEEQALAAKKKLETDLITARVQGYSQLFGALATLSKNGNKKLAAIGKAAAVTQATIDGYLAIQKALGATNNPFVNYGLAAAMAVVTGQNIANIMAQNTPGFAFGGGFTVGGTGGTDSQMVAFRATPGEKVAVTTPQQERDRSRDQEGSTDGGGFKIINVLDPELVADYLNSPSGERVLVNVIQRNGPAIKSVIQ